MLCGSCIQPKKQSQVQIIGILEEIDQKSTYEKVTKIWAVTSPPPHLDKIRRNSIIFSGCLPLPSWNKQFSGQTELMQRFATKLQVLGPPSTSHTLPLVLGSRVSSDETEYLVRGT